MTPEKAPRRVGRYAVYDRIASGGMATVHLGRLVGPVGFSRLVAVKVLHPNLSRDPAFVAMFLDEARIAARIRHPNVVQTLDIDAADRDLFLVMEYVEGESLGRLLAKAVKETGKPPPPRLSASIVHGALQGLHAAHEAKDEHGNRLAVVHRDVSPQNILVGVDGQVRVLDFGIAKAMGRLQTTQTGQLKGKLPYMAPEQVRSKPVDARTDVWGASVVLWETLTGARLFNGEEREIIAAIFEDTVPPPSSLFSEVTPELDAIVVRGLSLDPEQRFRSAQEMALALEDAVGVEPKSEIARWVNATAGDVLAVRAALVARVEASVVPSSDEPLGLRSQPSSVDSSPSSETELNSEPGRPLTRAVTPVGAPAPAVPIAPAPLLAAAPAPPVAAPSSLRSLAILALGIVLGGSVVGLTVARCGRAAVSPVDAELQRKASEPNAAARVAAPSSLPSTTAVASEQVDWGSIPEASPSELRDLGRVKSPAGSKPSAGAAPSGKASASCSPPFYYERGIKKYKQECLRQ